MGNKAPSADNQQGRLDEKLTPDYIVGLVDGEGYFSVSVFVDQSKNYLSRRVRLAFGIDLNSIDGKILHNIKDWFGCGHINFQVAKRENFTDKLQYQVKDMKSLREIIIPFFKRHPLKFPKRKIAFSKFTEIAEITENKEHLTENGFRRVMLMAHQLHS